MNENMLVSIDDAQLENANGGLGGGFSLSLNDTTLAGLSLDVSDGTISGSVSVLGTTISGSLGLKISL